MSLTKINPRGQITIPAKFRDVLNCKPGDYVEIVREGKILKVIPSQGKGKKVKNVNELMDELNE